MTFIGITNTGVSVVRESNDLGKLYQFCKELAGLNIPKIQIFSETHLVFEKKGKLPRRENFTLQEIRPKTKLDERLIAYARRTTFC